MFIVSNVSACKALLSESRMTKLVLLLVFSFFLGAHGMFNSQACVRNNTWVFRLPYSIIPQHYDLYWIPDMVNYKYIDGMVNITISVVVPTSCIIVNSDALDFTTAYILGQQDELLNASSWTSLPLYQQTVINFADPIPIGSYQLVIGYTGLINHKNATGLFKSAGDYPSDDGSRNESKWNSSLVMLATQFEMMAFRMAFPGWDEPQFKTTFAATVILPADQPSLTVLFNTPVTSDTVLADNRTRVVQFATTPHPMSCYLVAFAIGHFDYIQGEADGLVYRVYTPPGKSATGQFALNVTMAAIKFYSGIWNFSYSFPKIDSIAVPAIIEDAMENWGLLTYDPTFLLVDDTTPQLQRALVCQVITHELAHQWFGDTVTMPWWSQFFLNEGFARYFQYVSTQYLHPEYQIWTLPSGINFLQFAYSVIEQDATGMYLPAVLTPDWQYSGNPYESDQYILGMQESLAYGKGAAVVRMMATHMGDTKWNAALAAHLKKRQYTNPGLQDLVVDLGGDSYALAFGDWLTRSGFPLVNITLNSDSSALSITQKPISPFLPMGQYWWIPLQLYIQTASGTNISLSVDVVANDSVVQLPNADLSFVIANPNYTAFIVVTYSPELWNLILKNLHVQFDSPHILQLLQQTFILAQMAHEPLTLPLRISQALSPLLDSADVWSYAISHWLAVSQGILDTNFFESVRASIASVLESLVNVLGWSPDNASQLRQQAIYAAAFFDSGTVIMQAINQYKAVGGNVSALPWDTVQGVLYAIAQQNSDGTLTQLKVVYSAAAAQSTTKQAAQNALLSIPNVSICNEVLLFLQDQLGEAAFLSATSTMLSQNLPCRETAWSVISQQLAPKLWLQQGAAATDDIISAVSGIFWQSHEVEQLNAFANANSQFFLPDQLKYLYRATQLIVNLVSFNSA